MRRKRKRKRKILKTEHKGFSGGQKVPNFPSNMLEPQNNNNKQTKP